MGREAKAVRERKCQSCQQQFFMTAKDLKTHATQCSRLKAAGLVMPTIVNPQRGDLVKLYG